MEDPAGGSRFPQGRAGRPHAGVTDLMSELALRLGWLRKGVLLEHTTYTEGDHWCTWSTWQNGYDLSKPDAKNWYQL